MEQYKPKPEELEPPYESPLKHFTEEELNNGIRELQSQRRDIDSVYNEFMIEKARRYAQRLGR